MERIKLIGNRIFGGPSKQSKPCPNSTQPIYEYTLISMNRIQGFKVMEINFEKFGFFVKMNISLANLPELWFSLAKCN